MGHSKHGKRKASGIYRDLYGGKRHGKSKKRSKQRFGEQPSEQAKQLKPEKLAALRTLIATGRGKTPCCQSSPRCRKCPVVLHRLRRMQAEQLDDAALAAAVLEARWRR